jgi:hypothetical protein
MVNSKINAFLDCNHCSLGALPSPIKPKKSHKKISHQNQKTAEISVVFLCSRRPILPSQKHFSAPNPNKKTTGHTVVF